MLPKGTVLFTSRAGIGNTAILGDTACTNQGFQSIVPDKEQLDSYFIFSRSKELKDYGERVGAGSTFVEVSGKQMSEMELLIPDLDEQKTIGCFFERIDNLITLHQSKCNNIQVKNKINIRYNDITWEQRKLSELTSLITNGTTPIDKSGNGEINFIKVENIDSFTGNINTDSKITIEEHNNYLKRSQLKNNDILFSIAGTLGRASIVKSSVLPANTNQALAIIRLKNSNIEYLYTFLKSNKINIFIRENPTIGAQPNLSLEQVSNFEIDLPKEKEQAQIGTLFKNLDNLITLHQHK